MSIIYYYNACMHADTVHIIKLLNGKGDMLILVSMDKNHNLVMTIIHVNITNIILTIFHSIHWDYITHDSITKPLYMPNVYLNSARTLTGLNDT